MSRPEELLAVGGSMIKFLFVTDDSETLHTVEEWRLLKLFE